MFKKDALIIAVDDTLSARQVLSDCLEELGFRNVIMACDGMEALQHLKACRDAGRKVDLVIADWMMPNLSGLDLLQKLRSDPETATLPFLMITAESETLQIVKAIQVGVSDYIIKPFDSQALFKTLTIVANKAKLKD